ncbi:hypothetical protein FXO38_05966 [Capsicum annuum]|nr:hypothetical protein FXO37_24095 [Capsicum annuum]KAF3672693.1 hypothetical protein FXO38_05966 [Capsicum annuum]
MSMNPQAPSSWLEMRLGRHALTFNLHINGEQILVMIQHPENLAQIVTEGMRLGLDAFMQHYWTVEPPLNAHVEFTFTPTTTRGDSMDPVVYHYVVHGCQLHACAL